MKYTAISEEALNRLLRVPYNPPVFTEAFTEDDFLREHWGVRESVKTALAAVATGEGAYDDLDFTMSDDIYHSRGMSIELNSHKLWNGDLIGIVSKCLLNEQQDYSIYVDHDLPDDEHFALLLTKDEVMGFSDDKKSLERFGFK